MNKIARTTSPVNIHTLGFTRSMTLGKIKANNPHSKLAIAAAPMIPDEPTKERIANTPKSATTMKRIAVVVFISAFLLLLDGEKWEKYLFVEGV